RRAPVLTEGLRGGIMLGSVEMTLLDWSRLVYAIFEDSGRQYKVSAGDLIYVAIRDLAEGQETIEFDRVLAVGEGAEARFGRPLVEGAKVVAKVGKALKGPKVIGV